MRTAITLVLLVLMAAVVIDEVSAGFGCPGDQYQCNEHCKSIGCRGGYCDAKTLYLRCTCAGCPGLSWETLGALDDP